MSDTPTKSSILISWSGCVKHETANFATHHTPQAASDTGPRFKAYSLTHVVSGRIVAFCDDRVALGAFARHIEPLADWSAWVVGTKPPEGFLEARKKIVGVGAGWCEHDDDSWFEDAE